MAGTTGSAGSRRVAGSPDAVRRRAAQLTGAWILGSVLALLVAWSEMRTAPVTASSFGPDSLGPESFGADSLSPDSLGGLLVPVKGVSPAGLSRQFDDMRSGGRAHHAIDILAPRHTPVLAAADGRIARLRESVLGGIAIYQYDANGRNVFYYAHLERYAPGLREGATVRSGDVIGFVGTTGNAPKNTPHLHFAIFRLERDQRWWQGTPIDPYDALVARRVAVR